MFLLRSGEYANIKRMYEQTNFNIVKSIFLDIMGYPNGTVWGPWLFYNYFVLDMRQQFFDLVRLAVDKKADDILQAALALITRDLIDDDRLLNFYRATLFSFSRLKKSIYQTVIEGLWLYVCHHERNYEESAKLCRELRNAKVPVTFDIHCDNSIDELCYR